MFVDASALVAVLADEPDRDAHRNKIDSANRILLSAMSIYETVVALMRIGDGDYGAASSVVANFSKRPSIVIVPIDAAIGTAALDAFARYGKGRHRAALNMGDCFSYACAKVHRVPLLCKGGDFKLTDIKLA
jgi:ribonuclease VapC